MPFLPPNQQRKSTKDSNIEKKGKSRIIINVKDLIVKAKAMTADSKAKAKHFKPRPQHLSSKILEDNDLSLRTHL